MTDREEILSRERGVTGRALVDAIAEMFDTIEALHGPAGWDIYREHAPEMRRLRAALEDAKAVTREIAALRARVEELEGAIIKYTESPMRALDSVAREHGPHAVEDLNDARRITLSEQAQHLRDLRALAAAPPASEGEG